MMGFQDAGIGSRAASFFHYQRLECRDDGAATPSSWRWLPASCCKAASAPCCSPAKKLRWSRITSVLLPRKVAELSSKIRHAGAIMDTDVSPVIIFSSQWGLPVLSRPLLGRSKVRYPHGKGI